MHARPPSRALDQAFKPRSQAAAHKQQNVSIDTLMGWLLAQAIETITPTALLLPDTHTVVLTTHIRHDLVLFALILLLYRCFNGRSGGDMSRFTVRTCQEPPRLI